MSTQQEQLEQRKQFQDEQRAADSASQQASEMARRQMEEKLHNPQFAETIRDPDLEDTYQKDIGPEVSKAHAVANRAQGERDRIYWKTVNKRERRIAESNPGFLLQENPLLLSLAQGANKPDKMSQVSSVPLTTKEKRKMRGSYEVSEAIKSLGIDNRGLEALTTATAEHRTVTNEQESENNIRNRVRAFFD